MKTKSDVHGAPKTAVFMFVLLVIGSLVSAQTKEDPIPGDLRETFNRLEAIMLDAEKAARYDAKTAEAQIFSAAINNLEMLASLTEQRLKYTAPIELPGILPDEMGPDAFQDQWLAIIRTYHPNGKTKP
jgi:hypothetical protein